MRNFYNNIILNEMATIHILFFHLSDTAIVIPFPRKSWTLNRSTWKMRAIWKLFQYKYEKEISNKNDKQHFIILNENNKIKSIYTSQEHTLI